MSEAALRDLRSARLQALKDIASFCDGHGVALFPTAARCWARRGIGLYPVGRRRLMGNGGAIGEAFQITGDETLTWDQIYETIAGALGVELRKCHVASEYLVDAGRKYGYRVLRLRRRGPELAGPPWLLEMKKRGRVDAGAASRASYPQA